MNEDILNDLKQFITATVQQSTSHLATKDDIARLDVKLSTKIDDLDLKVDTIDESLDERLAKLER